MAEIIKGGLDGGDLRIGIVVSRWNSEITTELLAGALRALASCAVLPANITVMEVPGAFEIPVAVAKLVMLPVDAVIALGCVIKGETAHFEYVATAAMHGISEVALRSGIPVTCGILTTYDIDQALARAGRDENNKGSEAALSAVETAILLRSIGQANS
jgi:6,7-dimethyl-8-ribityllumazine synthase